MKKSSFIYSPSFYQEQMANSAKSAKVIVPLLYKAIKPESVIDVGCGVGTWLKSFQQNGVKRLVGVEGRWINSASLLLPDHYFRVRDLNESLRIKEKFDLVCCLEVAEHIDERAGKLLVKELVKLSDVVYFSAAIPGQTGTRHVNEQWQDYWAQLFEAQGFVAIDYIRPQIWNHQDVEFWYAQNSILYVRKTKLRRYKALNACTKDTPILSIVHPKLFMRSSRLEQLFLPLIKLRNDFECLKKIFHL